MMQKVLLASSNHMAHFSYIAAYVPHNDLVSLSNLGGHWHDFLMSDEQGYMGHPEYWRSSHTHVR